MKLARNLRVRRRSHKMHASENCCWSAFKNAQNVRSPQSRGACDSEKVQDGEIKQQGTACAVPLQRGGGTTLRFPARLVHPGNPPEEDIRSEVGWLRKSESAELVSNAPVSSTAEPDPQRKKDGRVFPQTLIRAKTRGLQAAQKNGVWCLRSCARRDWSSVRGRGVQTGRHAPGHETRCARSPLR